MANEVEVKLRVTENGIEIFDDAGKKMEAFDKSVQRASGDEGGGGLKNFVKGMADAKAAYDIFSQSISQSAGLIDQVNQIGVVSLRAKAGYEALGGSADTIAKMQEATRGLVDDTLLYQEATHAMSSEAAKSADDLVQIAQIGATLGITFRGDAAQGVMDFTKAIESVGNVRSLRGLGIDVQAVRGRLEELKGTMSDADAWRLAVFEVAGNNAKKLADNLSGTGTALERVKIRFDDFIEGQSENVAKGLEAIVGWWEQLEKNPTLTLTVTLNVANAAATGGLNSINDGLTDWLNQAAKFGSAATIDGQQKFGTKMLSSPMSQDVVVAPYGGPLPRTSNQNRALHWLNDAGEQQKQDAYMQSILDAAMPNSPIQQRRRNTGLRERAEMGGDALREQYVAPFEADQKQAREAAMLRDIFKDLSDTAGDYSYKVRSALAPLQEQNRILQERKSIQSIDDAFGTTEKDGLYAEVGGGMSDAIAQRRAQMEADLEKTGRRYGKNSKKYKAAAAQLEEFDQSSKDTMDEYAIATGSATKESIRFRDQLDGANKAFAEGKISLSQYKNELLLLGEAAKAGVTSMDQLTQIQRRLNFDLRPGTKTDADKSLFDQYARGVPGTKSSAAAGDKETGPFDFVVASADKASNAAAKVGAEGARAIGTLVTSGTLVVGKFGEMTTGADTALQKILTLKQTLSMLASIQINITTTPKQSGSGSGERTSARGMR